MRSSSLFIGAAVLMFTLSACNRSQEVAPTDAISIDEKSNTRKFYGPTQQLGNGIVRAYTKFSGNTPIEIGIDISQNAIQSLPDHHAMLSLQLHPVKRAEPYTHVLVDWAPHGHEPAFYEVPHFDFHFYAQPEAERLAIGPMDPEHDIYPAPMYMPANHFPGGGVPQMGNHWLDLDAPELAGEPFTKTFIYGTYDGKVTFYEPMVTLEYLLAQGNSVAAIPQPQAFLQDGYYPVDYRITHTTSPNTYTVAMSLEYRSGE